MYQNSRNWCIIPCWLFARQYIRATLIGVVLKIKQLENYIGAIEFLHNFFFIKVVYITTIKVAYVWSFKLSTQWVLSLEWQLVLIFNWQQRFCYKKIKNLNHFLEIPLTQLATKVFVQWKLISVLENEKKKLLSSASIWTICPGITISWVNILSNLLSVDVS